MIFAASRPPVISSRLRATGQHLVRSIDRHAVVLPAVWLAVAVYLYGSFDAEWIPHDDGTLAHSAERVLAGELPHRDFDAPYTGGLTLLHAATFRVLGVGLVSLRWLLFVATLAFVPAVYAIAARFARPLVAGLVTLLCLAWSVPNYSASMPSWYNLFLATFGSLALFRHIDTGGTRWLFVAGVCGGLSFLAKSVGLYYVAAVLLFLVFREQLIADQDGAGGRSWGFGWFTIAGLLAFCAGITLLVGSLPPDLVNVMSIVHFAVPGWILAALLIRNEVHLRGLAGGPRWRRLATAGAAFLAGAAVPVALFLVPYALSDSMGDWWRGVFVVPRRRLTSALSAPLPPAWTLAAAVPMLVLLFAPLVRRRLSRRDGIAVIVAAVLSAALTFGDQFMVRAGVWFSVRPLVPLTVIAGALMIAAGEGAWSDPRARQRGFVVVAMAALVSLVQVPLSYESYFFYAAPMAALAVLAVVGAQRFAPRGVHLVVAGFYLAYAVVWLHSSHVYNLGTRYTPLDRLTTLNVPRGGIRVRETTAATYEALVREVQAHSAEGSSIYAATDCPEVYFLSDRRNPTRTFFDVFDEDWGATRRTRRILRLLEERGVEVVVASHRVEFSGDIPPDLEAELVLRYPNRKHIGNFRDSEQRRLPLFTVLWRDPPERVARGLPPARQPARRPGLRPTAKTELPHGSRTPAEINRFSARRMPANSALTGRDGTRTSDCAASRAGLARRTEGSRAATMAGNKAHKR